MKPKRAPFFCDLESSKSSNSGERFQEIISQTKFKTDSGKTLTDLSSISFHASLAPKNKIIQDEIIKQIDKGAISLPQYISSLQHKVSVDLLSLLNLEGKIFFYNRWLRVS